MAITNRPADGYIDDLTAPAPAGNGVGGGTAWLAQLQAFMKQLWGVLFEAEATLASDTFNPAQAAYSLIPQSGTADNLARIGAGFDGMVLRIRPKTGNTITVKNAQGGAGQILVADAADLVMADPTMRLVLVYSVSAAAWIEEDRMYGANKAAFTAWLNAATSSLAGIIKAAAIAVIRTGTATDTAVTPAALASLWKQGSDIASATTLVKPADANLGGYHVITGTTPVTAMWAGVKAGEEYEFEAGGALPLTNGANFVLKGGADILCAAGDTFRIRFFGSSLWKMVGFERADGSALTAASKAVPVRQTVLSGPVDSNGLPSFGGSTGGTTVTASGVLVATAANGFAASGPVDRIGAITNPSWTGLSTNGTMYLYLDIAADGACTAGSTTLAPNYQQGGTYSVTSGQFTFNIQEMVGKVGNGATAAQTYRVFVGEVTVAGGVVTAIIWYALMGRYFSAFTTTLPSTSTTTSFNHNIGCLEIRDIPNVVLECVTTDGGYAVGDRVYLAITAFSAASQQSLLPGVSATRNVTQFSLGGTLGFGTITKGGGGFTTFTAAKWKYAMSIKRGW